MTNFHTKYQTGRAGAVLCSHQDVSLQQQAGFDGDADARVAVSLHIAAGKGGKHVPLKSSD